MAPATTNPYEVLGVPRDAGADDIKAAYRKLALKYHPDRNPGDAQAEERFKEVSEAYATLRDPESRARWDRFGSTSPRSARPDFGTVDWQTVFREADVHIDWDAHRGVPRTGNAVFDALFGVMAGAMRQNGLLPGEHRDVDAAVPLAAARDGGSVRVHVPGPSVCPTCSGSGRTDGAACPACSGRGSLRHGAAVDVQVPAGVRDGTRLRLRGLGGPGRPPGDALVQVRVKLPANARAVGRDLHAEVALTPLEADRGARVRVLDTDVDVPPGAPDGALVRVAGAGLGPAGDRGDLRVTVRHDTWRGLLRAARGILRRFEE